MRTEDMLDQGATEELMPRVLPPGWSQGRYANTFTHLLRGLAVIMTVERHDDGKRWLHVSVSHRDRIPTWSELTTVKDIFMGRERKAIQVLPAETEYVNDDDRVLHLWSCLDADPLPDFRRLANGRLTL